MESQTLDEAICIFRTLAFVERATVNPQVSLLNLTLDTGIWDVMWPLIDGRHIVSLPHHDGLFVDRVYDCLDERLTGEQMIASEDNPVKAPNDTAVEPSQRWSRHSGLKLLCKLCQTSPPPSLGPNLPFFRHAGHADPLGNVETNPGPTTLNKKVWICDICHKQIHVRKHISIRSNRIEHWVHLRCAGIHQAQYTDTWTCHLHRESRLTPHTDITPLHRSRPWSKPLPTPHLHHPHHRKQNTDTCPTLPLSPQDW